MSGLEFTDEEKRIFADPTLAKYRVFTEGQFLPVGRMFGAEGQIVTNPLHAQGCVAFSGKWSIVHCRPGDVEPIREGRPWLH